MKRQPQERPMQIAVDVTDINGSNLVTFHTSEDTNWWAMVPEQARAFAACILQAASAANADCIKGNRTEH